MVWYDMIRYDMIRYDMIWCGIVCYGKVWYVWYGMVCQLGQVEAYSFVASLSRLTI